MVILLLVQNFQSKKKLILKDFQYLVNLYKYKLQLVLMVTLLLLQNFQSKLILQEFVFLNHPN